MMKMIGKFDQKNNIVTIRKNSVYKFKWLDKHCFKY